MHSELFQLFCNARKQASKNASISLGVVYSAVCIVIVVILTGFYTNRLRHVIIKPIKVRH